jgi:HEPN domain-containing protein
MDNKQRSKMLFGVAEESLAEAEFSFGRQSWALVVRRCQEAVELELSGILALAGIHFPKNHDQAPLVLGVLRANNISLDGKEKEIELISVDLSRKRGPALHQEEGYDRQTAEKAVIDTKLVFELVKTVISQLEGK